MKRLYPSAVRLKLSMQNNSKEDYIVIISSCSFPYGNASDNAIYTFMDGFQEHGCKGEVLCLYPNLPEQYNTVKKAGEYKGVKFKYLIGRCHPFKNQYLKSLSYRYLTTYRLKQYLRRKTRYFNVFALFIFIISLFRWHYHQRFVFFSLNCHVDIYAIGFIVANLFALNVNVNFWRLK